MYTNIDRDIEHFVYQILKNGTYANKEELSHVLSSFSTILKENKDKTLEEIGHLVIQDILNEIDNLRAKGYPFPGINVALHTGLFNVDIISGRDKYNGKELTNKHLFDLASVTKLFTGIIAYHLINEGYFKLTSKINELHKEFKQVNDLTIGDIMCFGVDLSTGKRRINDAHSKEEALDILYGIKVIEKGKHRYTDMGMVILKEVMEKVTGKSYVELFEMYITKPLDLKDTYILVPINKRKLLTGTPNFKLALPNDPKACIMGGHSGNAGVFSNGGDLITFGKNISLPGNYYCDLYTPGLDPNVGKFGVTFISHPNGLKKSFVVDKLYSRQSFGVQGSTRTQLNIGDYIVNKNKFRNVSIILMNPSSMGIEEAKARGIFSECQFRDENGKMKRAMTIDARKEIPLSSIHNLDSAIARSILKLTFLTTLIKKYEVNYNEGVNINCRHKPKIKRTI